jgi:hypothetical protein
MFVVVANRRGRPLPNVHVRFRLEGDGTFHSSFEEKSVEETTSEDGEAYVTWWEYPMYRPKRELTSKLTVTCDEPDAEIIVKPFIQVTGDRT